jgi:hypothetical protein
MDTVSACVFAIQPILTAFTDNATKTLNEIRNIVIRDFVTASAQPVPLPLPQELPAPSINAQDILDPLKALLNSRILLHLILVELLFL